MNDQLKDFINKHRDEFDHRTPSGRVWASIQRQLSTTGWWHSVVMWRAAAMLLAALSVYLYFSHPVMPKPLAKGNLQMEFRDLESFYTMQISEKVALIENMEGDREVELFVQDIQKLDAMYQVLRDEMKLRPTEKVRDALVLNLLVRIDLLNQQIQQLEQRKKQPEPQAS